jgi:hypothetical protein
MLGGIFIVSIQKVGISLHTLRETIGDPSAQAKDTHYALA